MHERVTALLEFPRTEVPAQIIYRAARFPSFALTSLECTFLRRLLRSRSVRPEASRQVPVQEHLGRLYGL